MSLSVSKKTGWHRSLLLKTTVILICIFIVPLLILYSFMQERSTLRAIDDVHTQIERGLENLMDSMNDTADSVFSIINRMQTDAIFSNNSFSPVLQRGMGEYNAYMQMRQISRSIYQYYLSNAAIQSITLYNPYCGMIFSSEPGATRQMYKISEEQAAAWDEDARQQSERTWSILHNDDGTDSFRLRFSLYSSNDPRRKLYVRMTVSSSLLRERYLRLFPSNVASVKITDEDGNELVWGDMKLLCEPGETDGGWMSAGEHSAKQILVWKKAAQTQWKYIAYGMLKDFSSSASVFDQYLRYFIIVLALILSITLVFLYTAIIRPLHTLSKGMKQAEQGDLNVRMAFRQHDEIGYIGHRFNAMLQNIQHLIKENYETRMLRNEFELKFVQTQLKEHFIYNTLDSIHWIAVRNRVPEISEIIFSLSKFFRLTLSSGADTVTIAESKEILNCYLSLINKRLDYPIDYTIFVEPGLEKAEALKYPFQPLVENAYQHGVRHKKDGSIQISFCRANENHLCFTVEDNGNGMAEERLEEIREKLSRHATPAEQEDCFALLNIDRQLHLYYGDDYRFEIESHTDAGTKVRLEFPLEEVTAANVPNDHRR